MKLIELINLHIDSLTSSEHHFIKYIVSSDIKYENVTVNELSKASNISTSTIHRCLKKLGFEGFSDFKYFMINEQTNIVNEFDDVEDYKDLIMNGINITLDSINEESLNSLLDIIYESNYRYIYGTGWKQSLYLQSFSNDLLTYNKSFIQIQTLNDLKSTSHRIKENDLVIIASLSGNTPEVGDIIKYLTLKGVSTVSITKFGINELSKNASLNFYFNDDNYINEIIPWPALTLKTLLDFIVLRYFEKYGNYR